MYGTLGFFEGRSITITEENFAPFRNQGGYHYLGRSEDQIHTPFQLEASLKQAREKELDGLVIIGATHSLTDAIHLNEYFLQNNCDTKVIGVPATVDGNIHHKYIATAVGFDTSSKVYSQLIGNMLTDSASAVKYWYFMRLMGKDPSHLTLECALRCNPNMVIISEECSARGETLIEIVDKIADLVQERAILGKNYGCIVIPEGLLSHLPHYKQLIEEINNVFSKVKEPLQMKELSRQLFESGAVVNQFLTPWSAAIFQALPDFTRKQLLNERDIVGTVKISMIETEKLLAYLVDKELEKRKKAGKYKGKFTPVTHYFGYQGRCSYPSLFDCTLASTYGYTAGVLIESGLTGMCVMARMIAGPLDSWRIGGVPIVTMLRNLPKTGYNHGYLVVPSEEVNLNAEPYQRLKMAEESWRLEDHYKNPGPIQFYDMGKDGCTLTRNQVMKNYTKLCGTLSSLASSVIRDSTFVEHEHLLIAAISYLRSVKTGLLI